MLINNIKPTKNGYDIYILDRKINIEKQVFSQYLLKKGQQIDEQFLDKLIAENFPYFVRRKALVYLVRKRSTLEFENYLKTLDAKQKLINSLTKEFTTKGYLDDLLYAEMIVRNNEKRYGKARITMILNEKGINSEIIAEALLKYNDNLEDLIIKAVDSLKADNLTLARKKLVNSFFKKGYNLTEINQNLDIHLLGISLPEDKTIVKHYQKALAKYNKKYAGYDLYLKIKKHLYDKGFSLESIEKVCNKY